MFDRVINNAKGLVPYLRSDSVNWAAPVSFAAYVVGTYAALIVTMMVMHTHMNG